MKKRWIAGALCAAFLGLTACVSAPVPGTNTAAPPAETTLPDEADSRPNGNASQEDEYAEFAHIFGLTAEQRQEDFAYFEQELRDSYPCWGLLQRQGVDIYEILDEYREMVEQSDNDFVLYVAVNSALYRLGGQGHLSLIQPEWYEEFRESYREIKDEWNRTRWYEALNAPKPAENYPKLLEACNALNDDADDSDEDGGEGGGEGGGSNESNEASVENSAPGNVTSLMIDEGHIAYLKIDSFDGIDEDRATVSAFLEQARGCDHLILDITQNGGGSDEYWMQLLAAPLAKEPLSSTNYALIRDSENTSGYLEEAFRDDELHPIDHLPNLPQLKPKDRSLATRFVENTISVEPTGAGFDGKVWLLVSGRVYSAAEAFTVFCKDTGFATVVGEPTNGDGIGIDPVFFMLPNSGLLVRYSPLFGLNPDGSSNEEFGTTPDILSPEGETPLVTALRAIREG